MQTASATHPGKRDQRGFVMLSLVLLAALMVSLTMGYARHAIVAADSTSATVAAQLSENALGSGVSYAKQALKANTGLTAAHLVGSERTVAVSVQEAGAELRSVTIQSLGGGESQTVTALAEVYPAIGEEIPSLTFDARRAVWEFPSLIDVTADQVFSDTDLTGIVLLRKGVDVTFDDVVLRGTIVTENALSDLAWNAGEETSINVTGGLLIEPGSTLAGCAVVGPDCDIVTGASSALQIQGVIVAASLQSGGHSILHGLLATTAEPTFSGTTDFPGAGRAPRPWPTSLETPTQNIARLVFTVDNPTSTQKDAIKNFPWGGESDAGGPAIDQLPNGSGPDSEGMPQMNPQTP